MTALWNVRLLSCGITIYRISFLAPFTAVEGTMIGAPPKNWKQKPRRVTAHLISRTRPTEEERGPPVALVPASHADPFVLELHLITSCLPRAFDVGRSADVRALRQPATLTPHDFGLPLSGVSTTRAIRTVGDGACGCRHIWSLSRQHCYPLNATSIDRCSAPVATRGNQIENFPPRGTVCTSRPMTNQSAYWGTVDIPVPSSAIR
jgi:hypothetical protein